MGGDQGGEQFKPPVTPGTPAESEPTTVIGSSGIKYQNIRVPDPHRPGEFTDRIVVPGESRPVSPAAPKPTTK